MALNPETPILRDFMLTGDSKALVAMIQTDVDVQKKQSGWWAFEDWNESSFRQMFFQLLRAQAAQEMGHIEVFQEHEFQPDKSRADIVLVMWTSAEHTSVISCSCIELKLVSPQSLSCSYYKKQGHTFMLNKRTGRFNLYNSPHFTYADKLEWFDGMDDIAEDVGNDARQLMMRVNSEWGKKTTRGSSRSTYKDVCLEEHLMEMARTQLTETYIPAVVDLYQPEDEQTFHLVCCFAVGRVFEDCVPFTTSAPTSSDTSDSESNAEVAAITKRLGNVEVQT